MLIISVISGKGGAGKSTAAVNLASGLARRGLSVVLLDMDPQGAASASAEHRRDPSIVNLLRGDALPHECARPSREGAHDVIPASPWLAAWEREAARDFGQETTLSRMLLGGWDLAVIDTAPGLGLLSIAALAASDGAIVMTDAGAAGVATIGPTLETVDRVRERLRPTLETMGVLVSRVGRTRLAAEAVATVRERFGSLAFETTIPERARCAEALGHGVSVLEWSPHDASADAFRELTTEVLARLGERIAAEEEEAGT